MESPPARLLSSPEWRSAQADLASLIGTATRIHAWLPRLAASQQALHTENQNLRGRTRALEADNARLHAGWEEQRHAMMDAVEERDAALGRLRRVEKAVRELVGELEGYGKSPTQTPLAREVPRLTETALTAHDARSRRTSTGSASPSVRSNVSSLPLHNLRRPLSDIDEERTPRPSVAIQGLLLHQGSPAKKSSGSKASRSSHEKAPGSHKKAVESPDNAGGSRAKAEVASPSAHSSSSGDSDYIHGFKKAPKAATTLKAVPPERLSTSVGLSTEEIYSLDSLAEESDFGMRLQITRDAAFVYKPTVIESKKKSYFLSWATPEINARTTAYIRGATRGGKALHTFSFNNVTWHYIGLMNWTVEAFHQDIWKNMVPEDKPATLRNLEGLCRSRYTRDEIAAMLDTGALQQLCVQISGADRELQRRTHAYERLLSPGKGKRRDVDVIPEGGEGEGDNRASAS